MTSTAHALVAGAIAARFSDPVFAVPVALTSHYIMDSIPHWDFGTDWRKRSKRRTGVYAIAETVAGISIAVALYIMQVPMAHLLLVISASLLPDWLETPWYIFFAKNEARGISKNAGMLERAAYFLYKTPNVFHAKAPFPLGVYTQIATVLFFWIILR